MSIGWFYNVVAVAGLSALIGCQPATTSNDAAPAQFEVRDFSLEERVESYGTTTTGRGTLVAASEPIKRGSYLVFLTATRSHKNDSVWRQVAVMRDGIATFATSDFLAPEDRGTKIKYEHWKIEGFAKLQEGVVVEPDKTSPKTP